MAGVAAKSDSGRLSRDRTTGEASTSSYGWVAEWTKAAVLKTAVPIAGTLGSNPSPSVLPFFTAPQTSETPGFSGVSVFGDER